MSESYKEFRNKMKSRSGGLSDWIWKAIVFVATTSTIWLIQKKWLKLVSGDYLEIIISIGVGLFFSAIYATINHFRILLKSAWEDSNRKQETIEKLKTLIQGTELEPNCTFEVAIELIKEMSTYKNLTHRKIEMKLFEKAFNKSITVWGKPVLTNQSRTYNDVQFVPIPHEFFFSPEQMTSGGRGYGLNVGTPLRGWDGWRGRNKYYYVSVNREQIMAKFSPMIAVI